MHDINSYKIAHEEARRTTDVMQDEPTTTVGATRSQWNDKNNSSIVSKRSVEKVYHKSDNGFLRYFVKKFQRRSPLINRGYWIRMRAVERVVRTFLGDSTRQKKAVVNLGCGYDTLPFKLLAQCPKLCEHAKFIDVDRRQLMLKKGAIVKETPELATLLSDLRASPQRTSILLSSKQYMAISCDVGDVRSLDQVLHQAIDVDNTSILFLAEFSMTDVEATAAEAVLEWAAGFSDARFCLLEPYLPDGSHHPFAALMLKHFDKMKSPLKSAVRYPSLGHQARRLSDVGWNNVDVRSLWELWTDDTFITEAERLHLDSIEPFDEWEEFVLFASHHFLLVASTLDLVSEPERSRPVPIAAALKDVRLPTRTYPSAFHRQQKDAGCRRFGAMLETSESEICYHGGYGVRSRLRDCDTYARSPHDEVTHTMTPDYSNEWVTKTALMCHTITSIGNDEHVLVGGRASPDNVSASCLIGCNGKWTEMAPLPHGLFRHCAVSVCGTSFDPQSGSVLVFGGKRQSGEVQDEWLCWKKTSGWQVLEAVGQRPPPRFGASMIALSKTANKGLLTGGMSRDGKIFTDLWMWEVVHDCDEGVKINCSNVTQQLTFIDPVEHVFGRFGSTLVEAPRGLFLVGGVSSTVVIPQTTEILRISDDLTVSVASLDPSITRPLLIGCGIEIAGDGSMLIVGGGGTCFSFGTFWNEGTYSVGLLDCSSKPASWQLVSKIAATPQAGQAQAGDSQQSGPRSHSTFLTTKGSESLLQPILGAAIEREQVQTAGDFESIVLKGLPVILRGLELGTCTKLWDADYLKARIGEDRKVVVHSAKSATMNFLEKNFNYVTTPFGDFVDRVEAGEPMYLRSLSSNRPAETAANLSDDFPTIAQDFALPSALRLVKDTAHSSPFRISGPVTMWLHYDVMANVLCQVRGEKKLVLFPPSDIDHLGFPPGATSSRLNVFDRSGNAVNMASTHPMTFELKAGDVLFIPALWPHTAQPTGGMSIAVNVFFRSLESGYAAGKDVYGNRDLQAYENGRRDIQRMVKAFRKLPADVGQFYMRRLAAEVREAAEAWGDA